MKRALPDTGIVKAAIDAVLAEAAARGRRPTVTAIERLLGIPHATFHRHYADLIDRHFRPRIPEPAQPATTTSSSTADARAEANLSRLRRENTDLRRTLALYEEAIRQLALENDALRGGGAVVPLPARSMPAQPWILLSRGGVWRADIELREIRGDGRSSRSEQGDLPRCSGAPLRPWSMRRCPSPR